MSGASKSSTPFCRPGRSRAKETEDSVRQFAYGLTLGLQKSRSRSRSSKKKRRKKGEEQTVNLLNGLELSHNQGQLRNTGSPFLQDGPQVRPPYCPNPCLFLGNRTRDGRQASNILGSRRTGRNLAVSGSGSSFAGCLRRSSEDGLRRRHIGQGPLCFAGHCSAGRGEAREEE